MQHVWEFEVNGHKSLFHRFITIQPTNTLFIYKYLKGLIRKGGGNLTLKRFTKRLAHQTCDTPKNSKFQRQRINMTLGRPSGSKKTKRSGTSSSVHVHHLYASRLLSGRTSLRRESLNATAIHKRQVKDRAEHALRQESMSKVEKDELNAIRQGDTTNDGSNFEFNNWGMDVDSILAGAETMDISHAGGEFSSLVEISDDLLGTANR
jgi:hypothetical protein